MTFTKETSDLENFPFSKSGFILIELEVYIRTEWELAGQLLVNKSLELCGTNWTSSAECSETDCAIRCAKFVTCTASMFLQSTFECTLVYSGNVTVKDSCGSTSVRVKNGGPFNF